MSTERVALIRGMPVFGGLSDAALDWLLDRTRECGVDAGECFFESGQPAESLYVLERGRVAVLRPTEAGLCQLAELGPGDCFGEMSLIDFNPRSATVRAVEPCLALEIPQAEIHALYQHDLKQFTLIQMNFARELSRRLRRADELVCQTLKQAAGHRYST